MMLSVKDARGLSKSTNELDGTLLSCHCYLNLSLIKYIKVHTATRWTIRHSLMLHWFADLMNVTEEVTIHRPNVSTLLSSAFIRGDLNAATRGPFHMITN